MTNCGGVFYAGPHAESQVCIRYLQARQLHLQLHTCFICCFIRCFELTVIRSTIDMIQTCKSTIENKSLK